MKRRLALVAAALAAPLLLAACQQGPSAAQRAATARAEADAQRAAEAQREYALYQQMLARKDTELAADLGTQIVQRYPGTAAASAVEKNLPALVAQAKAVRERRRLRALWDYQTGVPMAGGVQNTASIYDTTPGGTQGSIQLILRRQSAWGQSVYLYGQAPGFVCKGLCQVPIRVDGGQPQDWAAYLPPTGEPALFIKNDVRFIAMLEKAHSIEMTVRLKDAGTRNLRYQVGGFQPGDFPPLSRKH